MVLTLNYHFVEHDIAVFTQIDITLLNNDSKGKKNANTPQNLATKHTGVSYICLFQCFSLQLLNK